MIRQQVSYMPQRFGLYEDLSVQQNLNLYADLRNVVGAERQDAFERLLAFTDLERFTGRLAGELSGGMKQKLGLACALIRPPRLLLLDEPSVGVDPISRRELWKMVYDWWTKASASSGARPTSTKPSAAPGCSCSTRGRSSMRARPRS